MELTSKSGMPLRVEHNEAQARFEIFANDERVGLVEYVRNGDAVIFTHAEVSPSVSGQGVGTALVRSALDGVRERGLTAVPICPFVVGYLEKHIGDYRAEGGKVRGATSGDYALIP
ncbi:GNAT family N-acetyltransferase [Trueperella pecoris]|uniref:GNAT family N-acetyltransferase n=1 Tax=Trueperella pecoris TaxID=2733571 RepID=UPI001ABDE81E|nr:GNAT family N-acetyltransferase [Trueperella pecoris]QTG74962.1 N-acetyltransferase [Trueperella pecoris]